MNTYDVGIDVVLIGKYENRLGVAIDPDVVSVSIKNPDGTVVTYASNYYIDPRIERIDVGHYELTLSVTQYGIYYYYWYSTGTGKTAGENYFEVRKSKVLEVL